MQGYYIKYFSSHLLLGYPWGHSLRTQTHFRLSLPSTRYCSGGEMSDDRKYVCVRRLVRAIPIQEIHSIYVEKRQMADGTHRRPCGSHSRFNGADFLRGGNGSWSLSVENNANRFLFQKDNLLIHNGRSYSTAPAWKRAVSRPMKPSCGSLVTALLLSWNIFKWPPRYR